MSLKTEIHGAAANQEETDEQKLYKNSRRIKGIAGKQSKSKESIFDEANTLNPNVYEALNVLTSPKNDIQEVKRNQLLRNEAQRLDIYLETVSPLPLIDEQLNDAKTP